MSTRPIGEGLLRWPDQPQLLGSTCRDCRTTTFPAQGSCPRCTGSTMDEMPLARRGTLWTWTVQGFAPKPPYCGEGAFAPYGVGYVELDAEGDGSAVLVECRLTESDPERLHIGAEMELVVQPFCHDAAGDELVTFAFAPVADRQKESV